MAFAILMICSKGSYLRQAAFAALVPMLAGCAEGPRLGSLFGEAPHGPKLAAATLPSYAPGDKFRFDDGSVETVVSVGAGAIEWRSNRQYVFSALPNPVMPLLGWETRTRKSKLDNVTAPRDALWPLRVGNETSFTYQSMVQSKESGAVNRYAQYWRCSVPDTETVSVPAGTFDTFRIECIRTGLPGSVYGKRVWFYAPSVGHSVKTVDKYYYAKSDHGRSLVSVERPAEALSDRDRVALDAAEQKALSTKPSGEPQVWQPAGGDMVAQITPVRTYKTKKGYYCRQYRLEVRVSDHVTPQSRTACRMKDGVWRQLN